MRSNYIRGASMSCAATQTEIRDLLLGAGAYAFQCSSDDGQARVAFRSGGHQFQMAVTVSTGRAAATRRAQETETAHVASQNALRQGWRQLSALIRAKVEAVASGIVSFDEEFLAYMLLPGRGSVFRATAPAIAAAYAVGGEADAANKAEGAGQLLTPSGLEGDRDE